ncbi:MAG TPA: dienelactone hydrolase family protein [Acidimicrobiales bacterium]|nr:dienelactone hydrolase family protein [Acidimicrobiales bacterium]
MTTTAEITIETADGPMPAHEASPGGSPRGGILVVQEAFGVTTHIEGIANRLADAGWYAIAPAFFHRQGSPVFAYDDLGSVMPVMGELSAQGLAVDVASSLDHLEHVGFPPSRIGVVGFCMGGSVAFFAATTRAVGAAVTFYGGGVGQGRFGLPSLIEQASSVKTPWLGLYGDLDKGIPTEEVEQLRDAVSAAPVSTEIVRYARADHGFNCDDRPSVFNASAAADAWARTLDWFDAHLGHEDGDPA